jgi:hypothetical protein
MRYVRCVNNETYFKEDLADTFHDLIIGQIYKVLPVSESECQGGLMRVIDDSGEAYLYPEDYFEPLDLKCVNGDATSSITVHLPTLLKGILHAEALAADKSMGALVREWIEERLDLPRTESQ